MQEKGGHLASFALRRLVTCANVMSQWGLWFKGLCSQKTICSNYKTIISTVCRMSQDHKIIANIVLWLEKIILITPNSLLNWTFILYLGKSSHSYINIYIADMPFNVGSFRHFQFLAYIQKEISQCWITTFAMDVSSIQQQAQKKAPSMTAAATWYWCMQMRTRSDLKL